MSATHRFVLVTFTKPVTVEIEKLKSVFSYASDWMRYAQNCWVLYTGLTATEWRDRLRAIPGMETENIFVCEFDYPSSTGYMPQWIWDWFNKSR